MERGWMWREGGGCGGRVDVERSRGLGDVYKRQIYTSHVSHTSLLTHVMLVRLVICLC